MARSLEEAARLLAEARAGSRDALGRVLEACRRYLLRIANNRLADDLQAKGGGSDLVQQTFLEAQRDFEQFQGVSEGELRAWLRQLLLNNLGHFQRRYRATAKRDVGREVALDGGDSSAEQPQAVIAETPTPSQQAAAHEEADKLQRALQRLPEEHCQVILLRHHEQLTFESIGQRLQRSASAARMLWLRAVERLQQELEASS
jgi:RNA polymerase sigma-70 factor (ECF subfamily)